MAAPRDVTPIISKLRNLFLGHQYKNALRFEAEWAPRTQTSLPNLPDGPSSKLSANYYCTRDGRRDLKTPVVSFQSGAKLVTSGGASCAKPKRQFLPGFGYNWTSGEADYNPPAP